MQTQPDFTEANHAELFALFAEKGAFAVCSMARDKIIEKANALQALAKESGTTPEIQRQALSLRTDLSIMQAYVDVALIFNRIESSENLSVN